MAAEIIAIKLNGFMRYHRSIGHGQNAQKRWKRLGKFNLESGVIQSGEGILLIIMLDR